ncbi:TRANK1 [Symbiodinium natans]|uniref:TRANK1 protein n=1 Tax=Symbiodinium natans TaxID=878477 RepID=A0A812HAW1_9DINO|nr:TRANK1 [Symbiodinium natans]
MEEAEEQAVKKEELLRRLEAEILADVQEEPQAEPPDPPAEPAAAPSDADDTASVVSGTTVSSRLLGREGRIHFDEQPAELEPVAEVEGESEGRKALDDIFAETVWTITFCDEAYSELKRLVRIQQKAILDIFLVLASGKWPEDVCEKLDGHGHLRLRRAVGRDQHVLWSVDMEYDSNRKLFVEVIKVWHVLRPEQSAEAAAALVDEWKRATRDFRGVERALKNQKVTLKDGVRCPRNVLPSELQDSDVLSLRKFYSLDWRTVRSILLDDEEEGQLAAGEQFMLRTSKQEDAVIQKPGPNIVIGRSGSGKTLCCLYRMFHRYLDYWNKSTQAGGAPLLPSGSSDVHCHLNQVFVTHSAGLANKVLEYFTNMQQKSQESLPTTRGALQRSGLLEQSRHPDSISRVKTFPLFVTFRKFLIMVDGSLQNPFFPRRSTGIVHPDKVTQAEAADGLDPISALREQRRAALRAKALFKNATAAESDKVLTEVDYDLFEAKFWPKLRQKVPAVEDAMLVWREFMSFIKGSYRVLETEQGHLDLETYQEVTSKCSPGFREYREQIFAAFKSYEQLKKDWHGFDRMDVARHVIQQLRKTGYKGPPIHASAVDEVQDLAQLELALFFVVMKKPYEDLFLTGDTSQTVSRAVEFRFCDLRSVFHDFNPGVKVPELDQLLINYRSHQKILALSHRGVVQPLEMAFPYAIDKLAADRGHRDGVRPIIVTDVPLEDLAQHMFNLAGCSAGIAFGASQCILVRNEESRKKLPKSLSNALVLTVEQSKGLEFDDCILVNFFTDSLYKEWRTMEVFRAELLEEDSGQHKRPQFERIRHALLCSELKHLYTAITRTKHVLLFIEQDSTQADHVFNLWRDLDLVSKKGLLDPENAEARAQIYQHAGENRGKDSWVQMGHSLLRRKLYEQARSAFLRGEDEDMAKRCEAFLKAVEAARTMEDFEADGMRLFREAAQLFEETGAGQEQAECLLHGGHPEKAAQILEDLSREQPELKVEAARAWTVARKHELAAPIYEEAEQFHDCIEAYLKADLREEVTRVVPRAHQVGALKAEECFRYLQETDDQETAGLLFFHEQEYEQAASCYRSAGNLHSEAQCYLELGEPLRAAERLIVSEHAEHLLQAADLYKAHKDVVQEAKCYRALLEIEDLPDRRSLLESCIELHERLQEWGKVAEYLEKLHDHLDKLHIDPQGILEEAAECYEKARLYNEAACAYEKLSGLSYASAIRHRHLRKAAALYSEARALRDKLRVLKLLDDYEACGQLAQRLGMFQEAAEFFKQVGTEAALEEAVQCLISAKDFTQAYDLFGHLAEKTRNKPEGVEMEIKLLEGLGKFDAAARRIMANLPQGRQRAEMALRGFRLARKDAQQTKAFLDDFGQEMPDDETALIFWAELGDDAAQICDLLVKCGKPLAAAAAASELGDPAKALELLRQCPIAPKDWHTFTLDILMTAVQQQLSKETLPKLKKASDELRCALEMMEEGLVAVEKLLRLDFVDAALQRLEGTKGSSEPALRSWWDDFKRVPPGLQLCFFEELALAQSAKAHDAEEAFEQLAWYIQEVSSGREIEELLKGCYQADSKLQRVLYDVLNGMRAQRGMRPVKEGRLFGVLAKGHRLSLHADSVVEVVPGFSGAVCLKDKRSALLRDLEERQVAVLKRFQQLCKGDKKKAREAPSLWLRAWKQLDSQSPQAETFKDGFIRSLRSVAATDVHLHKDVINEIPDAAAGIWLQTWADAESKLRSKLKKSTDFDNLVRPLQETVRDLVNIFRHYVWENEKDKSKVYKIAADRVATLVFGELDYLKPICPRHVSMGRCEAKLKKKCDLEHPDVEKTHLADELLARSAGRKATSFDGIGLPCWLDVVNICHDSVEKAKGCNRRWCKWVHPDKEQLEAIRKKLRTVKGTYYYNQINWKSDEDLKLVLDALLTMVDEDVKLPKGFGCCFFQDENDASRMLNVRLVTIVAWTFLSKRSEAGCDLGLEASVDVLQRMCRALYRYPDAQACTLAKKTLAEIRDDRQIRRISNDITWEVEGCQDKENVRCLLSTMLGREKAAPQQAQQRQHAAGSKFAFNPKAQEFVPGRLKILQRDAPNQWAGGNAATALFGSQPSPASEASGASEQLATEATSLYPPRRSGPAGAGARVWWQPKMALHGAPVKS